MNQPKELIELIEQHQNTLTDKNRDDFYESTTAILSICQRFYNKESAFQKDLEYVRGQLGLMMMMKSDKGQMGMTLEKLKEFYNRLLNSIISEVKSVGFPSKNDFKVDKSVNVNVHQNQSQTMEINFVVDAIKDELTGKQLKELKEIIKSEPDPKKAKSKTLEKIKEFGINVTSGIVSSIISNPTIWTMIG
jgi:hypothetical protein